LFLNSKIPDASKISCAAFVITLAVAWQSAQAAQDDALSLEDLIKTEVSSILLPTRA
jgi:hypothetical protein